MYQNKVDCCIQVHQDVSGSMVHKYLQPGCKDAYSEIGSLVLLNTLCKVSKELNRLIDPGSSDYTNVL